ncbi:acyltransferase [Neptunicella marina]|uniref:Acyltransferase n=1 Tax=Neptunicella marina TaxID=2125989 RepID=A0A8J6IW76_9ALTE|nr:acyltransferase [Neptunicella marina]MBC3766827.1 acyltransferase [Neptunicella marina]
MRNNLIGVIAFLLYTTNTLICAVPIISGSVLKLIPIRLWQKLISSILDNCATTWVTINTWIQRITCRTRLQVTQHGTLTDKDWYLVIANHQSWVDILVLQRVFNRKIPFLKFFLKRELIWVPVLGLAWWALDFPFMQRYSKAFLKKYPHLKGKDLETTRKACEKFRFKPVSIMNFVEGTRFQSAKHKLQQSPFNHLLKPRAGGIAFVLSSMGDQLHKLLDVTIHYPGGVPSFWDFICGKVKQINVDIKVLPISSHLHGNYFDNAQHREAFQNWLNQVWVDKDKKLLELSAKA